MAGPTSVSINNNNLSMYEAFKALTTNRDKNRGTIEVSTTGDVTQLKCTQHHFYSSSTIRPNANLNDALAKAITAGVHEISNTLIQGFLDKNDGAVATDTAKKVLSLMNQIAERLTAKLSVEENGISRPKAMSRKEIQEIVSSIEALKNYSVDELQKIGVDNLCNPKFLKDDGEKTAAILSQKAGHQKTAVLLKTLIDDKLCREAAKMDFSLKNCETGSVENCPPVARCKQNPFEMKSGTVPSIVKAVQKGDSKAKICTQVCADAKHYACGVFVPWPTQEETVVRNMDPMASAHLKGKGLIRPEIFTPPDPTKPKQYRLAYTHGENRLSTSSGYMMKSKLGSVKSDFLFSSLPALGEEWQGMDTVGNTDYYCIAREQALGRKVSEVERAKANELFDYLCELRNTKRDGLNIGQFKTVMMYLMFSGVDLAAGKKEDIVSNAINAVTKDTYDKAKVAKGYEDAIRKTIRAWIDTARNRGVTHFVGSAVGCGVFNNDVNIVSRVFAEEFVSRAGDMKFVYANFNGTDNKSLIFKAAFNKAYADLANV